MPDADRDSRLLRFTDFAAFAVSCSMHTFPNTKTNVGRSWLQVSAHSFLCSYDEQGCPVDRGSRALQVPAGEQNSKGSVETTKAAGKRPLRGPDFTFYSDVIMQLKKSHRTHPQRIHSQRRVEPECRGMRIG